MPHVRLLDHRVHRRVDVLEFELRGDVVVEHGSKVGSAAHK